MRKYSNNASTTLRAGIDATDTTIPVYDIDNALLKFPDISSADDYAILTLQSVDGGYEIVKATSINIPARTITVIRGTDFAADDPDKTVSRGFITNDRIELRTTAGAFESNLQRDGDIVHGGVFGLTPAAPDYDNTILVKHTTEHNATPTLQTGELALDAGTRSLWAGCVDLAGDPETLRIFPGMYVQSTVPFPVHEDMLWFDTTTTVQALKIYNNGAWKSVIGFGELFGLILANNQALFSANSAGTANRQLIKLNDSNEINIGDPILNGLIEFFASNIKVTPKLTIAATDTDFGEWTAIARESLTDAGVAVLTWAATALNSMYRIQTKSPYGNVLTWTFHPDGTLRLPSGITPTEANDAASKKYVDDTVASIAYVAGGRVNSTGGVVGAARGFSVSKGTTGVYTVNLPSPGVSSANNMIVNAVPIVTSAPSGNAYHASVEVVSATQFKVYMGSNTVAALDLGFSFTVFDSGA